MTHADTLAKVARDHGITLEVTATQPGPTVTAYRMTPAPGVKPKTVASLVESWTLALGVPVRYLGPHKGHLVVEVPNDVRQTVTLEDMGHVNGGGLKIPLGVGIDGAPWMTLDGLPHMLVAGATGQGKSVYLNAILVSLLKQAGPDELQLALIDPKRVELAAYADLPHLVLPVATEVLAAREVLEHAVGIMDARYREMRTAGVKKHSGPPLVVVIDELADLMMTGGKSVEALIIRIAGVGRAAGVHLIAATQYPKKEVITGLIKQNIPTKVAFTVNDHVASNLILGTSGAEALTGKGDALVMLNGALRPIRVQAPMVSDEEVAQIVARWAAVTPPAPEPVAEPEYREPVGPTVAEIVEAYEARQRADDRISRVAVEQTLARQEAAVPDETELLRAAYRHGTPEGHEERITALEQLVKRQGKVIEQFETLLRAANMV